MNKALEALLKLLHNTQRDGISYEEECELYKTIRTALTSQTWQRIETLKYSSFQGEVLLCIFPVYRTFIGLINVYGDVVLSNNTDENGYPKKCGATHWMPLPNPPQEG